MTNDTITFAVDGDISLAVFADEVGQLSALLVELQKELYSQPNIEWVIIDLKAGSAELTMRGDGPVLEAVEGTVEAFGRLGQVLALGTPIPFAERVRERAERMVAGISLENKITALRFETRDETHIITAQPSGNARPALLQAYGTVTGKIQTLSSRHRLSFTLYDALFDKPVNCYLAEGQDGLVLEKWNRMATVEGRISRDPLTGRPVAIRNIVDIALQPDYGEGDYRQARGLIPWRSGDETPEAVLQRLRDEW